MPGKGAGNGGHEQALDVWFGGLWRPEEFFGSGERIEFVDPVAYDAVVRSERRVPAALGAGRCSGDRAAARRRSQLRDDSAGRRAHRWRRGRVDRRRPCPRRRGLRDRNDRDQPLDPHDRVGPRVAPPSLPRRPPGGHVGSRPWRSRSWRPRSASTKSSPRPHRSSSRSSSTPADGDTSAAMNRQRRGGDMIARTGIVGVVTLRLRRRVRVRCQPGIDVHDISYRRRRRHRHRPTPVESTMAPPTSTEPIEQAAGFPVATFAAISEDPGDRGVGGRVPGGPGACTTWPTGAGCRPR